MNKKTIPQIRSVYSLLLSVLLSIFSLSAFAQDAHVTINETNVPMEQIMKSIEKQTSYLFVIGDDVDISQKVSVVVKNRPAQEALDQMVKGTKSSYRIEGSNIFFYKEKDAPKEKRAYSVRGTVSDVDKNPLIGVVIVINGTSIGTVSDHLGSFNLTIPSTVSNPKLNIAMLGYETQIIPVGSKTDFAIVLGLSSVEVDEVVVTALGIKRSEKALSYNVQQVANDEIVKVKDANFINSLSGKVAGVTINSSSSGIGGASKVVMRGTKSIMQSSNALYVINGVPMFNFGGVGGMEFDSGGSSEGAADFNPEDIESVQILTGAAAAALYGSNAANGAVLITTKKGHVGKVEVTVSSNTEILTPFVLPNFQSRYGSGNLNSAVEQPTMSWGNKLNKANYSGYNPLDSYFQTGFIGTETVSVSRGTERNQTYFSAGAVNSKGIVPNNKYNRYNFTYRNTTVLVDDKLTMDYGGSYIIQGDRNMVNQGVYMNPLPAAYLFPRGGDWQSTQIFEHWDPTRKIYTQNWEYGSDDQMMQNPYWSNYRNLRENKKDRFMMNMDLDYKILDWLSASGRIRIDNATNDFTDKRYASSNSQFTEKSKNGYFGKSTTKEKQTYGDVLLSVNKSIQDFSLDAHVGASFYDIRYRGDRLSGPIRDIDNGDEQTGIPNVFTVEQLSDTKTLRNGLSWTTQNQSVYATAEVGYVNTYYLTITGRNDWPSQLAGPGSKNNSFFYPSVGGSVVLSQIIDLPKELSYLKLRASYAEVGLAFEKHLAWATYAWSHGTKSWDTQKNYPIKDLKPERTQSWEAGVTARLLKYFDLDISYYYANTLNQTFNPAISVGSGYKDMYLQDGKINNQGIELSLKFDKTWSNFRWSSTYTFSTNKNKILEIGENSYNRETGEKLNIPYLDMKALGRTAFILRKGGSIGDLYSKTDLLRDANGKIYVDEKGNLESVEIPDSYKWVKLGSVLPKANMAWGNSFAWKNLSASFLISARLGGVVFSRTQGFLDYYGVSEATANARDNGGVWINGGQNKINAYNWYSTISSRDAIAQYYTYSATNVRLQEVSIGYTIPKKKLGGITDITLSLVGRNLWMIYNKAPFDPESVASLDNYYQGVDYFMMPTTRNIGFNVRFKF